MRRCIIDATFIQYVSTEELYVDPLEWPPFYIEDYWEVIDNNQPQDWEVPDEYKTSGSE